MHYVMYMYVQASEILILYLVIVPSKSDTTIFSSWFQRYSEQLALAVPYRTEHTVYTDEDNNTVIMWLIKKRHKQVIRGIDLKTVPDTL